MPLESEWAQVAPLMENVCHDPAVSIRAPFLQRLHQLIETETLETPQLSQVSVVLLNTAVIYQDSRSKGLVTKILETILRIDMRFLGKYTQFIIDQVTSKPGSKAVVNYLNLLEWVHSFLKVLCEEKDHFNEYIKSLVKAHTFTTHGIQTVLDARETKRNFVEAQNQHRKRIRQDVLNSSAKTIVICSRSGHDELATHYVSAIADCLLEYNELELPAFGVALMFGALTQASLQLLSTRPALHNLLKTKYAEKYSIFIGKEIVLSKNPPSVFSLEVCLRPFLHEFVNEEYFSTHLLPYMEKANLRAPEISFKISSEIYSAINSKKVNLVHSIVTSKILAQVFSSFKSSNEAIRYAALHSIIQLLSSTSVSITSEDDLSKLIEETFKNMKSNMNSEYRLFASRMLYSIPTTYQEINRKITHELASYITKGANEATLNEMLSAFFVHYFALGESVKEFNAVIMKGFSEKKAQLKKLWLCSYLKYSTTAKEDIILDFQSDCLEFIKETLYVHRNGHLSTLVSLQFIDRVFDNTIHQLIPKVQELLDGIPEAHLLGHLFLSLTLSASVNAKDRLQSVEILKRFYQRSPESIGISIIESLERKLQGFEAETEDVLCYRYITPVLNAISQSAENSAEVEKVLIRLFTISQFPKFNLKGGWADLVLNAKNDPSKLIEQNADEIINRLTSIIVDSAAADSDLGQCAIKGAAYAAFINPSPISPALSRTLESFLTLEEFSSFTTEELQIWSGKEGELVIDVLANDTSKQSVSKNTKDYETLKWEEEVRKNQVKKANKKLSKEEHELVKQQLAKETLIRAKISKIALKLRGGINLINELTKGAQQVDNGRDVWFPVAVGKLLTLVQQPNSFILVDVSAVNAFLHLSSNISKRLESARISVGVAILRVYQVKNITSNYLEEPLSELLSRVLFRVKFVSDQSSLDSVSLTYLLPLLIYTLEEGKRVALRNADKPVARKEFVEEDKEEEHLLLAMDIIAVHAEQFEDPSIPRIPIMKVLLSLLALPSKAKIAKECFNTLCRSISVAPTQEDLSILLSSLLSPSDFVRSTVIQAIDEEFELKSMMKFTPEVYICRYDSNESNRKLAEFIWQLNEFEITTDLVQKLLTFFKQSDSGLRLFTARAYASGVRHLIESGQSSLCDLLGPLMEFYSERAQPVQPVLDNFGLVAIPASEIKDPWEERSTIAIALRAVVPLLSNSESITVSLIKFLVQQGPLGDREPLVRQEMKEAGIEIITQHGASNVEQLIPIFEESLKGEKETSVKENVIILYGSLARHLNPADDRIGAIINRLVATLDTPSPHVQQAVSACLSPLVFLFKSKVASYINDLMAQLLNPSVSLSYRMGAAWGISGLVKGYGILALSEFDIIRNLIEAAEDKRESKRRESVAFAFENLSKSLGKFFEPYVIEVLPNILKNLGDSVPEVRDATANATKAIMSHTTSFGVKKLIPVAVSNLDEISWRTKRGSVELLGNMAYLDPTQLSASLPTIVPEIVGVLNDSHKEVRKAADESLKRFGEVIRNPEIQKLVPTLIRAIGDPTKYTDEALDSLIQTQFVHYIDGPSLALIIHVIHRGMHDRSANTKRKASKIIGNMAILVDAKDLVPYLQQLIDEVEVAMVDPVPATRATAARALGALVERLGEEQFPDLISRLLDTLSDEFKSGDRLGSAQALAEVICGLGLSKLDELLPTILAGAMNIRSYVREGFMPLLLFIPVCFGAQFAPYINQIIQPILAGLADNDEKIRDTSLKAGKLIVKSYASKAIDLLLPGLENGMFDENERIRLSSVQLTGELLFQVTGISSKNEFSEEEQEHSGEISKTIVEVLGQSRRDRILSALFVCRNDVSGIVRASTVDIWKALVPNTPRTVKEILPTLINMVVVHLASSYSALRNIAAQTLGDMVRRVGGNALSQLLPTMEVSLEETSNPDSRQGVCIALRELIESSSAEALSEYQETIVSIIRTTLVDSSTTVRETSALCFDAYQECVGSLAVDEVIPYLLHLLESSEDSECALLGLQEIMSNKSEVIFPILIPTLLAPPIDAFRASALGSLAEVAGPALYKRLSVIIDTLVNSLVSKDSNDEVTNESLKMALNKVFLSVTEEGGLHPLLQQIGSLLNSENIEKQVIILECVPDFFENTILDYSIYAVDLVSNAIHSLEDKDPRIVKGNFELLSVILKAQEKSELERFIKPAKQALSLTGKPGCDLAGFCLPKGPSCVLPIFLHGLMYGSNDEREDSALGIADVVSKTPAANLRPFVSTITGPLIRVVGERFNSDIKAAILFALNILFAKIPQFLRPFIPQLQRTFVKSLSDPSNELLRLRAAKALGTLIEYQPRVDPLVFELVGGAKQATDDGVKAAMLKALLEVVAKAGPKMSEASKLKVVDLAEGEMLSGNDKIAVANAKLIGSVSEILSTEEISKILEEKVLNTELGADAGKFGILTLNSFLRDVPLQVLDKSLIDETVTYIIRCIESTNPYFSDNGLIAAGKLLLLEHEKKSPFSRIEIDSKLSIGEENIECLVKSLCKATVGPLSNSLDSRRLALVVLRTLARFKFDECVKPFLDILTPSVFFCLRDTIIPIKLAAEKSYLAIFKLVEEPDMSIFNNWFSSISANNTSLQNAAGAVIQLRSISDYTKRVGMRLAKVERERIAEGGDAETMFSDRFEDEREIWSVGGVELNQQV